MIKCCFHCLKAYVLVVFRSFGGILFDVIAFLGLARFRFRSALDKPTSLNEKCGIFFNLLLISNTLGWSLDFLIPCYQYQ